MYIYILNFLCTGQTTISQNFVCIIFTVLITYLSLSAGEELWLHCTVNIIKNRRSLRNLFSFIVVEPTLNICYAPITVRRFQIVLLSFLERAQ